MHRLQEEALSSVWGAVLMVGEVHSQGDQAALEILFCADPSYYQHAAVAAVSLAENNRSSRINIHVLTCHGDQVAEGLLRKSVAAYGHVTLAFHYVSEARLERTFVDRHLTKETYMRFLAPEVFPAEVNRVLYLDCDLVVLDDLRPLLAMDMRGKAIAAAPDYPVDRPEIMAKRLASLGLDAGHTYVNAGVLVLDLGRWRRDRLSDRLFAYAEQQGAALAYHDQDTINAVLHDDIHVLDGRWNLQARMYQLDRRSFPNEFEATRQARRRPAILHYTTKHKPWLFRSGAPRKRHYFRYLNETAWRDMHSKMPTALQRMERWLGRQLLNVNIDYVLLISLKHYVASKLHRLWRHLTSARQRMLPRSTPQQ